MSTQANITMTSVDLSWTDANTPNSSSFEMEVSIGNIPPSGPPSIFGINTIPYTLSNLQANTEYCIYVRSVCGSNRSAWTSTAYCINTLVAPTSVSNTSSEKQKAFIYPNPSTGLLNIDKSLFNQAIVDITISDIQGRMIQHYDERSLTNLSVLSIEAKGVYFCRITLADGSLFHRKALIR